jgi:DNA polymerase III subunit beta
MKFTCTQQDLSSNLALVSRAVSARPTHPVLANVMFEADTQSQQVKLVGFDLSLGIQIAFAAQVEEDGTTTIPAKLLNDIVSKLPPGEISMDDEAGAEKILLVSSSGKYQVRGMSAEEFPELPLAEEGEARQLPEEALIEGLKGTLVACSQDEHKQILTGVYLKVKSDCLEFAATDGHRLSIVEVARETEVEEESSEMEEDGEVKPAAHTNGEVQFEVTVPARALRELEKMMAHANMEAGGLGLHLEQGQVVFECGSDSKLTTRTLEGKYPDYRLLIPKQFQRKVTVDRKKLLSSLERINVLADRTNLVKVDIDSEHQKVILSVEAQDLGSGEEALDAEVSGANLEIAFNIKYLMDGLKTISTQDIAIHLNGAIEPVILNPVGGTPITYLIMPVQLR